MSKPLSKQADQSSILAALLNDVVDLSYARKWMNKNNVSIERLKQSYISRQSNIEIVAAMVGEQSAKNDAFANIVGIEAEQTDAEIQHECEVENAARQDHAQQSAEELALEGGILLAENEGIAEAEKIISEETKLIALQNDVFRTSSVNPEAQMQKYQMGVEGQTVSTQGVRALSPFDMLDVLEKVATFGTFTEENDPYGERNFGSFDHGGKRIIWRIDYYDNDYKYGSEKPSDPKQTKRVLTIMLASEY